ncbi:NADH-cytochrome B5 reductase [Mycena kentingensis (nom. inval.)]|nr:NADH-cytochrome B5 reductase [Mycena kentingensis (nom. inval.)]
MSQLAVFSPQDPVPQARLLLLLDGRWKPIIEIDHAKARSFCRFPHRWFLYVATRIWAPGCDGALMTEPNGDHLDIDSPDVIYDYYFVCTSHHALRFPDGSAFEERVPTSIASSSSSNINDREPGLRDEIIRRDLAGVFNNVVHIAPTTRTVYIACHIIPQAKSSMYLRGLNDHRGIPVDQRVHNIDSIRNALLLSSNLHIAWVYGQLGFLPVLPDGLILQPAHFDLPAHHRPLSPEPSHMFICHHFVSPLPEPVDLEAPNNARGRYVQGDNAAALYLLDEVYVINLLNTFGVKENFPTVTIDLTPLTPEQVEEGEIEVKYKRYALEQDGDKDKDGSAEENGHGEQDGQEELVDRPLSNWEKLCILGARNDPGIRRWRRMVPRATPSPDP